MTVTLKREATRMVAKFHARWVRFLLGSSLQTLRRSAHELFELEQVHRDYLDGQVLALLRRHLEHAIQDISGSGWTAQRSMADLRGKTRCRSNNRRPIHVDRELQVAISRRILPMVSESADR